MLQQLKRAVKRNDALVRGVRSAYPAFSWVSNRRAVYTRVAPYLSGMEFDEVRLTGHNNEPEAHLRRTRRMMELSSAHALVLGVGRGAELGLWQKQGLRSLTATDYFAFSEWGGRAGVQFCNADARALPFADGAFDLVASTALLEHVNGVDWAVREMARVTRPGGLIFANFGPLFATYGGAHYEGAYEHLWMGDDEFERYLVARNIPSELDDGLLWLQNRMFSRLRYADYIEIFKRHCAIDHLVLAVSQPALRYQRQHPDEWRALARRYAEEDLLTFSITVWLRPNAITCREPTGGAVTAAPSPPTVEAHR